MRAKAAMLAGLAFSLSLGLAACDRGAEVAPAAEAPAEAWVGQDVVLYLPDPVMKARVDVAALSP
ncbi:MAG: hypothetical protein RSE34_07325, partial [Brevundimonas sp.]